MEKICSDRLNREGITSYVSCQDLANHVAMHVRQAAVNTILTHSEFFVIYPEQVQDCGMKIIAIRFIFLSFVTPIVASAVSNAGLDARSPKPGDEAAAIVIAAD